MTEHQLRQSYQRQIEAQGIAPKQAERVAEALLSFTPTSAQLFLLQTTWRQVLDKTVMP